MRSWKITNSTSELSNKVANYVITKTQFSTLVSKLHSIDTTNLVSKTKYEKDGSDFEDKINKEDKKYLMLVIWLKNLL